MPLPAGYTLDGGTGGKPPAGYTLDSDYTPPGSKQPGAAKDSLVSDALKYSPAGAVKGLADAIRSDVQNPHEIGSGVVQMMKSNAGLWDKAKASFKAGDYTAAAAHFLNYLIPGGQALEDAGESFQKGETAHGVAKTAGLASNFGVPAVMEGITSPTAARVPGAIVEGVKAAAPDIAAGAGKAAAAEVLAKVPGMEWPARIAVQYPALRQVKAGMGKFGPAFKGALADKLSAATETATAEAGDPILNGLASLRAKGGKFSDLTTEQQTQVRDLAQQFREAGSTQAKPAPNAPEPAPAQPGRPAAPVTPPAPPEPSPLDAIAQQGIFGKKYKSFAAAPAEAQAVIRAVVESGKPEAAPLATVQPPSAPSVQQIMRAVPDEAARAEFLRQREGKETPAKAVANGMYAQGKQTQAEAAETYEAAARTDKALKLAQSLHDHEITSAELEPHQAAELVKKLTPAAKALGINPPSTSTIPEVLFHLKRLEAAKAAGAQ